MNIAKRIFALGSILSALVLCAIPAQAQFYGGIGGGQNIAALLSTNITASTNFVLPPATNASVSAVPLYNMRQVVLTLQAQSLTNQYGSNAAIAWTRSKDGVNWDTTPFVVLIASVSTNNGYPTNFGAVCVSTNVDMGAYQWITPLWFTNQTYMTNCSAGYAVKPGF